MFQELFDPRKTIRHLSYRQMRNEYKAQQERIESWVYWSVRGIILFTFILWALSHG